jgi:hypothetical protein
LLVAGFEFRVSSFEFQEFRIPQSAIPNPKSQIRLPPQWLTIGDNDVRAEHAALSGNVVAPRADFSVGGSPAPYPGHWELPAGQRINCRCTTISVLV